MPDALAAALATNGLAWLLGSIFLCGLVFGFAGFGAALIFQPLAAVVVAPVVGIAVLSVASFGAAAITFPRALRQAELQQVAWIVGAAALSLPAGAWILVTADVTLLRWIISGLVALTLAAMLAGWRRAVVARPATLAAIGLGAGGLGGATGLHGPIVILFTLSGQAPAAVMRATMLVVLTCLGGAMLPILWAMGHLPASVVWLGLIAAPVYMAGIAAGQRAFDPRHERAWRWLGYGVVGASAVVGLPVWN